MIGSLAIVARADEAPVGELPQIARCNELSKQTLNHRAIEGPEALRLRNREREPGHLPELRANPPQTVVPLGVDDVERGERERMRN